MEPQAGFWIIVATGLLSAGQLGLGLWIGWTGRRWKRSAEPQSAERHALLFAGLERHLEDLEQCVSGVVVLARQASGVGRLVACAGVPLGEPAMVMIAGLVESIDKLDRQMADVCARCRDLVPAERLSRRVLAPSDRAAPGWRSQETAADLSGSDLAEVSRLVHVHEMERRAPPGKRYLAIQQVAPWFDDRLPEPGEFRPVQCQELSSYGLLYDTDELPSPGHVVVALGMDVGRILLLAEVLGHRRAIVEGELRYRVRTRFMRRLGAMQTTTEVGSAERVPF